VIIADKPRKRTTAEHARQTLAEVTAAVDRLCRLHSSMELDKIRLIANALREIDHHALRIHLACDGVEK